MKSIGIICEYNPFHNGHVYHINKIKELYPNHIIILVLNGYFLERGDVSIESKEEKTRLALKYGVDLVIEHPFFFSSSSADIFASSAIELLNELHVEKIVFGSESNDINTLKKIAQEQIKNDYKIKDYLKEGINYPTALNKVTNTNIDTPNDILALSYIKAILKNKYNIEPISIKRTNDFHDLSSNEAIISASNIRNKLKENIDIKKYIPEGKINSIDEEKLFNLLKYKIITEHDLSKYLTVDEGIDNRLKKVINEVTTIDELIEKTKSKRYTYNRIKRLLVHILCQTKKNTDRNINYIRILGFSKDGQKYLAHNKTDKKIVYSYKKYISPLFDMEYKTSCIYDYNTKDREFKEKIIKKE